jgi:hypothetical protein
MCEVAIPWGVGPRILENGTAENDQKAKFVEIQLYEVG